MSHQAGVRGAQEVSPSWLEQSITRARAWQAIRRRRTGGGAERVRQPRPVQRSLPPAHCLQRSGAVQVCGAAEEVSAQVGGLTDLMPPSPPAAPRALLHAALTVHHCGACALAGTRHRWKCSATLSCAVAD
jgi:hypothetical protein